MGRGQWAVGNSEGVMVKRFLLFSAKETEGRGKDGGKDSLNIKILLAFLDYIVAALMGSATILLVSLVVGTGWNMLLSMIVGMVLGMVVMFVFLLVFAPICTSFTILPPGMIITMVVGMAAGMLFAADAVGAMALLWKVTAFSLLVRLGFGLYGLKLEGDVAIHGPD